MNPPDQIATAHAGDRRSMITGKRTLLVLVSVVGIPALALAGFMAAWYFSMVSTVMTKRSPDRRHTAKLTRVQGIDVNFKVSINGSGVYQSPDFAPVRADFREQLYWDTNSQVVILEVAGRRIFGYHVEEKRPLPDLELSKVHLAPFEDLHFEGTSPKVNLIK